MEKENWFYAKFLESNKPYIWISLFGFITYARSLFFGFTYLDDNVLILDNLFFLKDIGNIFRAFTIEVFHVLHSSAAYYRPLLTISYMLDAIISGQSPFMYHFSSVVIHLVVSSLVFLLFVKLNYSKALAFIFGSIFAIHPLLAQAVSWIPGRNDSLLALFVIPAFIFFAEYTKSKNAKHLKWHWVFFALSLFTKESAIFLPGVMIFYYLMFLGNNNLLKTVKQMSAGWVVIAIIWYILRKIALVNPIEYTSWNMLVSVINNTPATILYLGKVFFPVNLSVLPTLEDSTLVWGFIALLVLSTLLWLSKNSSYKHILFGLAWFLVFLVPSFIRPSPEYVADFIEHRMYVPLIGLFFVIAEIRWLKSFEFDKSIKGVFYLLLIFTLSVFTISHTGKFKDRLSFWKNAVENSPQHPLAHKNLGAMYYLDGNIDEAEKEFTKAMNLNSEESMIYNNLGLIYFQKGDLAKAEEFFQKELKQNPVYDNAYFNWGLVYYQKGQEKKAEEMWLKTVEINPDHADALRNLAIYYSQIKDTKKANYFYQEATKRGVSF